MQLLLNTVPFLCSLVLCLTDSGPLTCRPHKSRKEIILHSICLLRLCLFFFDPNSGLLVCELIYSGWNTTSNLDMIWLSKSYKKNWKGLWTSKSLMYWHFVECKRTWNLWIKFLLKYTYPSLKTVWDYSHFGFPWSLYPSHTSDQGAISLWGPYLSGQWQSLMKVSLSETCFLIFIHIRPFWSLILIVQLWAF